MDLIFHIGTEKAGSTSLQGWLEENSTKLSEDGIVYCRSLLRPNNLGAYLYALGGGFDDGFANLGATTEDAKSGAVETFKRDFLVEVAEAKASGARIFVISNEHCHSRLQTSQPIQRIHDLVRPLFKSIAIWCFLRPQIDMCISLASTLAAGGIKITRDLLKTFMREGDYYFNYSQILANWARVFGEDNIVPIPFKRNKNTVQYFLDSLSLEAGKFSRPKRLNSAIDYRAIALSSAMDMPFYLPNGEVNRNSGFFIESLPVAEKLTLDRAFSAQLQRNFAASNADLTKNWSGITPDDLEPDLNEHPVVGNLDKICKAEEFGDYFRFVVERFNALLWIERSECKEAYSKIAEMRGDMLRALDLCQEALSNAKWANEVKSTRLKAHIRIDTLQQRIAYLKGQTNS